MDSLIGHFFFFSAVYHAQLTAQNIQIRKSDVVTDAELRTQPILFPVLRRQDNAGLDGIHGTVNLQGFSIQDDLAGFFGIHAEDRSCGLGPSGAHKSGKAHNLPFIQLKINIPHHASGVQVSDLKDLLALFAGDTGEFFLDLTAHHVGDDFFHGHLAEVLCQYVFAVPHDRHTVHDILKLLQTVGYVYDSLSVRPELADNYEKIVNFL